VVQELPVVLTIEERPTVAPACQGMKKSYTEGKRLT
jgi:hypothetical protein